MRSSLQTTLVGAFALTAFVITLEAQKVAKQTVTADGTDRTYYRFVPDGDARVPFIVLLHGSGRRHHAHRAVAIAGCGRPCRCVDARPGDHGQSGRSEDPDRDVERLATS